MSRCSVLTVLGLAVHEKDVPVDVEVQAPAKTVPHVDAAHPAFSAGACLLPGAQRIHQKCVRGGEKLWLE